MVSHVGVKQRSTSRLSMVVEVDTLRASPNHIRPDELPQRLGHLDAAVRALVVLDHRDLRPRQGVPRRLGLQKKPAQGRRSSTAALTAATAARAPQTP